MEDNDSAKLIEEMTEALQEALAVQDRYSETLDKLEEENKFLAETITQNNLGKLTDERRQMLIQMTHIEAEANRTLDKAQQIKQEYGVKLDRIVPMLRDVSTKQAELDQYIVQEAEKRIASHKASLQNKYKRKEMELAKNYELFEANMRAKLKTSRIIAGTGIIILCTVIVLAIVYL